MEITRTYEALILAGGKGSRLGGKDKGWVMWQGLPLIEHALACLAQQTPPPSRILISANRNIDAYQQTKHLVVADERADFMGPLAGIEAGLMRCKKNPVLVIPCDAPQLPANLYDRLADALMANSEANAAYVMTHTDAQPLCCLLKPSVASSLGKRLDAKQATALEWLQSIQAVAVMFDDTEAFSNFNSPVAFLTPKKSS